MLRQWTYGSCRLGLFSFLQDKVRGAGLLAHGAEVLLHFCALGALNVLRALPDVAAAGLYHAHGVAADLGDEAAALEEVDKYRHMLAEARDAGKGGDATVRRERDELRGEARRLERQKTELVAAFQTGTPE